MAAAVALSRFIRVLILLFFFFHLFQVKFLEALHLTADCLRDTKQVVVYDTGSTKAATVCPESFTHMALTKLRVTFPAVFLLKGRATMSCLTDFYGGSFLGCLIAWALNRQVDWLIDCWLVFPIDGHSVDWLIDWLAHWPMLCLWFGISHPFPLSGGYSDFSASQKHLCVHSDESATKLPPCVSDVAAAPTPREALLNCGPTQIFNHLYLGSEKDALSVDLMKVWHESTSFFCVIFTPIVALVFICERRSETRSQSWKFVCSSSVIGFYAEKGNHVRVERQLQLPPAGIHQGLSLYEDLRQRHLLRQTHLPLHEGFRVFG